MFIDILFLCAGIYMLVLTIKMKNSGQISSQLIGKKIDIAKAKDQDGYIKAIYPRNMAFGILLIAIAALGLINYYCSISNIINIIVFVAYIVGIVYYSIVSVKYQKMFLM